MSDSDFSVLELGDFLLDSGELLKNARLAYATYGQLNAHRDNCIVFPTYYTGNHQSNARMIGPGRALDPARYFIVVPNLFGNALSSSPSNTSGAQAGGHFPRTTIRDNVRAQHRLVSEHLGVPQIALVTGWSMGAVQSYQWAVSYPDEVERLLPFCGSARCWPQNKVFIEGVRAALLADPDYAEGFYSSPPARGLRAFGRVYAGWAYSPAFFRDALYRRLGFESIEALLTFWEDDHLTWDANDLLHKLWTWEHADPSACPDFNGDLAAALGRIRARTVVMPSDTDRYFTLEENKMEAAMIPDAVIRPFRSPYGHCAGAPGRFPDEMAFLDAALLELLATPPR
jgi:homoserine O-acetyltransferase/O-succinyltransferase